jgi:hypothetical protein
MPEIKSKIIALAEKYSMELRKSIDKRIAEMESDDNSHYLIYNVLVIANEEGKIINEYQNKGRFLYKYAGSFLENGFNTKVLVKTNNKLEFNLFGSEAKDLEDDLLILDATKGIDSNTKNNLYLLMQTKIPN